MQVKARRHLPTLHHAPRLICYHQTHFLPSGDFVSILPLLSHHTAVTHITIAAIHLNPVPISITLNDDPYASPRNERLWTEVRALQAAGISVLGMLGGAHKGSFLALDGPPRTFEIFYALLQEMVEWAGFDGFDLDVEETMSLAGIIRLVLRLKADFGEKFVITLAPVATAMQDKKHLSGFQYVELEKAIGDKIAWYNTQFYCGWGSMETTEAWDEIMAKGWPDEKIVIGLITHPEACLGWVTDDELRKTLMAIRAKAPRFGGLSGWEYFNSITVADPFGEPWSWANLMTEILKTPLDT